MGLKPWSKLGYVEHNIYYAMPDDARNLFV